MNVSEYSNFVKVNVTFCAKSLCFLRFFYFIECLATGKKEAGLCVMPIVFI